MNPFLIALIVAVLGSVFAFRIVRGRQVSKQIEAGRPVAIQVQLKGHGTPYPSRFVFARLTRTSDGGIALFRVGDADRTILIGAPGLAIQSDDEAFGDGIVQARAETMWGFECRDCAGHHVTLVVDSKMREPLQALLQEQAPRPTHDRKEVVAAREGRVEHTSFLRSITPVMWLTIGIVVAAIAFTAFIFTTPVSHVATVQGVESDGSCLVAYHSTLKDMPAQDYVACPSGTKVGDQLTITEYVFLGAGNMAMFRDQIQPVAMAAIMIALSTLPFFSVYYQRRKERRTVRDVRAPELAVVHPRLAR